MSSIKGGWTSLVTVHCWIALYEIKSAGLRPTLGGLRDSRRAAYGRSLCRSRAMGRSSSVE